MPSDWSWECVMRRRAFSAAATAWMWPFIVDCGIRVQCWRAPRIRSITALSVWPSSIIVGPKGSQAGVWVVMVGCWMGGQ